MDDLAAFDALFARLIGLTRRREDFLTECVAAVLQADRRAATDYWRVLSAQLPSSKLPRVVSSVRTQCRMGGGTARCDLVIEAGRVRLAVEHKIDAIQGRDQLSRYLALPRNEVTHVALVGADYQKVPAPVLKEPRFLQIDIRAGALCVGGFLPGFAAIGEAWSGDCGGYSRAFRSTWPTAGT